MSRAYANDIDKQYPNTLIWLIYRLNLGATGKTQKAARNTIRIVSKYDSNLCPYGQRYSHSDQSSK